MDDLKKNESSGCRIPNMLHKEEGTCHVSSEEANAPRLPSVMNSGDEKTIDKGTSCPLFIRPITPSPDRGSSILCNHNIFTSTSDAGKAPWSLSSSSSFRHETITSLSNNEECDSLLDDVDNDSPHTPKEMVFDPFAPGREYLACAPIRRHRTCWKEFKDICRRLSFGGDSCFDDDDEGVGRDIDVNEEESVLNVEEISEEMILECLYETLLETIMGKETEEGGVAAEKKQCDELKDFFLETPPCTILGVREYSSFNYCDANGDTCPGAPMKVAVRKAINVEAVRRRLEF